MLKTRREGCQKTAAIVASKKQSAKNRESDSNEESIAKEEERMRAIAEKLETKEIAKEKEKKRANSGNANEEEITHGNDLQAIEKEEVICLII